MGVATFGLHAQACGPDSGLSVNANFPQGSNPRFYENAGAGQTAADRTRVAFMRFYGRLQESGSNNKGFVVERRRPSSAVAIWEDITAGFDVIGSQWFNLDYHLNPAVAGFDGFYEGFEYRVRPVLSGAATLRCQDVEGSPAVGDFAYHLTVSDPCIADFTQDGLVNSDDLSQLLGAWGACASGLVPCWPDFNGDGLVNSDDLPVLLGSWGACPAGDEGDGGESLMEGGNDDPLYTHFGFESAAEYAAWFESLTAPEKEGHVAELMELILGE